MQSVSAKFVTSAQTVNACPPPEKPEYAFIGRSNVGKSSLINSLTNHKKLAKTSSTPGKTQLINHFLIEENWYLADLPGYGYAKVSKSKRADWGDMIKDYLLKRENLMCLFVLVDVRHEPQKIDQDFMRWVGENGLPFAIIFTKSDKLSPPKVDQHVALYRKIMLKEWAEMPPFFVSSAVSNRGREEIFDFIRNLNAQF